jgi:hypothetical protein
MITCKKTNIEKNRNKHHPATSIGKYEKPPSQVLLVIDYKKKTFSSSLFYPSTPENKKLQRQIPKNQTNRQQGKKRGFML